MTVMDLEIRKTMLDEIKRLNHELENRFKVHVDIDMKNLPEYGSTSILAAIVMRLTDLIIEKEVD